LPVLRVSIRAFSGCGSTSTLPKPTYHSPSWLIEPSHLTFRTRSSRYSANKAPPNPPPPSDSSNSSTHHQCRYANHPKTLNRGDGRSRLLGGCTRQPPHIPDWLSTWIDVGVAQAPAHGLRREQRLSRQRVGWPLRGICIRSTRDCLVSALLATTGCCPALNDRHTHGLATGLWASRSRHPAEVMINTA
jgi:hypothetical protein